MSDPPADAPAATPTNDVVAPPSSAEANSSQPNGQPATTNGTAPEQKPDNPTEPGSRKPRDARVIHLILASMGVHSYHERVPLMLMDFAYRYTSAVLQDALLFSDAINNTTNTGGQNPPAVISSDDLRMSIASRVNHQFTGGLPKEFLLDIAQERNRVALPTVGPEFGVRLPPEKYCLTGVNWDLAEGMEEFEEYTDDEDDEMQMPDATGLGGSGIPGGGLDDDGDNEEDEEKMDVDDLFGADNDGEGNDADSSMMDA